MAPPEGDDEVEPLFEAGTPCCWQGLGFGVYGSLRILVDATGHTEQLSQGSEKEPRS